MRRNIFKKFFLIFSLCSLFFYFPVAAQENNSYELMATWHANSFYPANYPGKPLPTEETPITVSIQILENGKIFDSSQTLIKWYKGRKLYTKGIGLSRILVYPDVPTGESQDIRITAEIGGKTINTSLLLPVVSSEIIIESSVPQNIVEPNSSVFFTAVPYFFNISSLQDLLFRWKIENTIIPNEKDHRLLIQFGEPKTEAQKKIRISVGVTSPDIFEEITKKIEIIVGK